MSDSIARDLIGEIEFRRNLVGAARSLTDRSTKVAGGFGLGSKARNLWLMAQGSNSAVLKKIGRGGTHSARQLGNQFDYLFGKSTSLFGNMVEHDPNGTSLTALERKEIVDIWSDGWTGAPKNGHTTHLLLSFPADLAPKKAKLISELWAAEMFQSGIHAEDEWAYVAALHSDRANPHVHIVVNNRGLENGSWFYMARNHVFNLEMMKERIVELASEEGVRLDATSRLERGILSYGPSRAEIENARSEGRPVRERRREGRALQDALAEIAYSAGIMRNLSGIAEQVSLAEIAANLGKAASILERGGIIIPKEMEFTMHQNVIQGHWDLRQEFSGWFVNAEKQIDELAPDKRGALRRELYQVSGEILKDLGDLRGAELMQHGPRAALHQTRLATGQISREGNSVPIDPIASEELRKGVQAEGAGIGLAPEVIAGRLEVGALNAWQEREWTKADLLAVAEARRLDITREKDRSLAAELVDGFYAAAAKVLDRALEPRQHQVDDRLTRTLASMARGAAEGQQLQFGDDDQAGRFADDLKERFGDDVARRIAAGDDRMLAVDFPDAAKRREVALSIMTVAKSHQVFGLSVREAEVGAERLKAREAPEQDPKLEREDGWDL
ncbi:relaxase/mobilization nuclease domain-containing protein [Paracoccus sp. CPCC 101403]|uniref:Relaxase/mobilization nuclease domain-containing protein n=1 Tax=Paracoccus broussonetiae TaxID=3075834 RepID=A0ABU3EIX4_9RHOB|nr:relaxase/mobilization nuclease domain-containing protein [Paracoccus sp. CPCC 101403]MDT1064179.1 relaxase/mobilization nuclease domain-containing protein [Paracoccus sp. CPCC 101403]